MFVINTTRISNCFGQYKRRSPAKVETSTPICTLLFCNYDPNLSFKTESRNGPHTRVYLWRAEQQT
jgi:hypothetical protein